LSVLFSWHSVESRQQEAPQVGRWKDFVRFDASVAGSPLFGTLERRP
jgi:hypothetical protein